LPQQAGCSSTRWRGGRGTHGVCSQVHAPPHRCPPPAPLCEREVPNSSSMGSGCAPAPCAGAASQSFVDPRPRSTFCSAPSCTSPLRTYRSPRQRAYQPKRRRHAVAGGSCHLPVGSLCCVRARVLEASWASIRVGWHSPCPSQSVQQTRAADRAPSSAACTPNPPRHEPYHQLRRALISRVSQSLGVEARGRAAGPGRCGRRAAQQRVASPAANPAGAAASGFLFPTRPADLAGTFRSARHVACQSTIRAVKAREAGE
jgi:hypothetical protein